MERSEERSSPRKIAIPLCNGRLLRKGIQIVGCDIKNLIKLSQCFGETTKVDIGSRMVGEYVNIARVEPLGFVELLLAPVALGSPPSVISQQIRHRAVSRPGVCVEL